MNSSNEPRFRLGFILPLFIPVLAGGALGFFLREIQASIAPHQVFLVVASLAAQLSFIHPTLVTNGSLLAVVAVWFAWSGWLHRRSGCGWGQALRRDALSYLPLLVLPLVALLASTEISRAIRWLIDPVFILALALVGGIKAWQGNAGPGVPVGESFNHVDSRRAVWAMFQLAAAMFATLGVLQFRTWNVAYVDSGFFEELHWNMIHGEILRTRYFAHNFLGEHAQFILLLLTPLHFLWPSMEWLTILQGIAMAAGVFPVWWLARSQWSERRAIWFPLLYLLQPALHFANAAVNYNTYRPEAFIVPSILFAVWFLESKRWIPAALCGLLVLLNREDMAIVTAAGGLYLIWRHQRWKTGLAVMAVSLLYFWLCVDVIIPGFSTGKNYTRIGAFAGLGSTPGEILRTVVTNPGTVLSRFIQPANLLLVCYLLLPMGLLCLGRLSLSLVSVPFLLIGMLTLGGIFNSIYFHYHNAPFAILMAAAPAGAARIAVWLANRFRCPTSRAQAACIAFAITAAAATTVMGSRTPLSLNFWFPKASPFHYVQLYSRTPHTELLERVRSMIPRDQAVCASIFAAAHFTHHRAVFLFPGRFEEADYVVVDLKSRWNKGAREQMQQWGEAGPPGFESILIEDGVFVFRRGGNPSP